jgi:hypothetical protein
MACFGANAGGSRGNRELLSSPGTEREESESVSPGDVAHAGESGRPALERARARGGRQQREAGGVLGESDGRE